MHKFFTMEQAKNLKSKFSTRPISSNQQDFKKLFKLLFGTECKIDDPPFRLCILQHQLGPLYI